MRLVEIFENNDDPCWDGYHMVGTKTKDGKEVPNCVPKKKESKKKRRKK